MPPGQDNGALVVSSSYKVFRASFLILPRKYAGISFVNSNKFLTYLWEDEMPRSEEASARPSELVNCPSSLSPWIWLLRTRAGPQAANASSGNPSQKCGSFLMPAASSSPSFSALTQGKRHCWDWDPVRAPLSKGKSMTPTLLSFGSDRQPGNLSFSLCRKSPTPASESSADPEPDPGDRSAGRRAQDTEPGNVQLGQKLITADGAAGGGGEVAVAVLASSAC